MKRKISWVLSKNEVTVTFVFNRATFSQEYFGLDGVIKFTELDLEQISIVLEPGFECDTNQTMEVKFMSRINDGTCVWIIRIIGKSTVIKVDLLRYDL